MGRSTGDGTAAGDGTLRDERAHSRETLHLAAVAVGSDATLWRDAGWRRKLGGCSWV